MGRPRIYANEAEAAQANRAKAAQYSRERSESVKEIGPLPSVSDVRRKEKCRNSLLDFMLEYGGNPKAALGYVFVNPFCDEQIALIRSVEDVLKHGGEMSLCIFRGAGKTTICEWGLFWAVAYGWQKFALAVAANTSMARRIVSNIRKMIDDNELIQADFPEICWPIQKLERVTQRARAQLLDGEPTQMKITADMVQFARVKDSPSSGTIIMAVGAEASFRGLREGAQRPTVVLIDDPQTNKSANSKTQTETRWENITTSMKGLAGPGVQLAMMATITVIKKGDLAERILEKWGGKRYGILRKMPSNMDAWAEYAEVVEHNRLAIGSIEERNRLNNEYYIEHRDVLDAGAEAAWETNYSASEVSAIQHAMNLYLFDERAFWSEYMNLPQNSDVEAENLTPADLVRKIRPDLKKGIVPQSAQVVTVGIDVQKTCFYWLAVAWSEDFSGHVLEAGRFPKGQQKLESLYPGAGFEEQIENGLAELANILKEKVYRSETGDTFGIGKAIVDANWGICRDNVKKICKQTRPLKWLEPTTGWGKGPNSRFFGTSKVIGEQRGPEWRKLPLERGGIVRYYTYNTNWWKSFARLRIQAGINARSTLTFYAGTPADHDRLFTHLLGETSSKLAGQYGVIDQWVLTPGQPNHWWDCLVMAAVAASASGVKMPDVKVPVASGTSKTSTGQEVIRKVSNSVINWL